MCVLLCMMLSPASSLVERDNLQAEHVPLLAVVSADVCCSLGCHCRMPTAWMCEHE